MENLAPPLELVIEIKYQLEKGTSLKNAILNYILQDEEDPWRVQLSCWLKNFEKSRTFLEFETKMTLQRKFCLQILFRGLQGESIHAQLCTFEEELFRSATNEVNEFVATLPIKSLVPLLLFQFPALILMMIGPLLSSFFS